MCTPPLGVGIMRLQAMNLNTITEVKRPKSLDEIPEWHDGYAWLAGGTWLYSTPQIATNTLIDLETLALAARSRPMPTVSKSPRPAPSPSSIASQAPAEWTAAPLLQALLPRAPDVVQDLQRGDRRREYLHVAAGRRHDLAYRVARGHLHALAARAESRARSRRSISSPATTRTCFSRASCSGAFISRPRRSPNASPSAALPSPISGDRRRSSSARAMPSNDDLTLTITASTSRPIQIKFDRMPSSDELGQAIEAHVADDGVVRRRARLGAL